MKITNRTRRVTALEAIETLENLVTVEENYDVAIMRKLLPTYSFEIFGTALDITVRPSKRKGKPVRVNVKINGEKAKIDDLKKVINRLKKVY